MPGPLSCATCKFWIPLLENNKSSVSAKAPEGFTGDCHGIKMLDSIYDWNPDQNSIHIKPEYSNHKAYIDHNGEYYVSLTTKWNFFCAHHEERI